MCSISKESRLIAVRVQKQTFSGSNRNAVYIIYCKVLPRSCMGITRFLPLVIKEPMQGTRMSRWEQVSGWKAIRFQKHHVYRRVLSGYGLCSILGPTTSRVSGNGHTLTSYPPDPSEFSLSKEYIRFYIILHCNFAIHHTTSLIIFTIILNSNSINIYFYHDYFLLLIYTYFLPL